jgi:hypothetical protein
MAGCSGAEKPIHRMAAEKRIGTLNSRIVDGRRLRAFGASLTSKFRYAPVGRAMSEKVRPGRPLILLIGRALLFRAFGVTTKSPNVLDARQEMPNIF